MFFFLNFFFFTCFVPFFSFFFFCFTLLFAPPLFFHLSRFKTELLQCLPWKIKWIYLLITLLEMNYWLCLELYLSQHWMSPLSNPILPSMNRFFLSFSFFCIFLLGIIYVSYLSFLNFTVWWLFPLAVFAFRTYLEMLCTVLSQEQNWCAFMSKLSPC